jgi:hypothetical protein
LAIIARGLPEVAVIDNAERPIALTLLRGFRRVISRDDDMGGQVLGKHIFRYDLVPFAGETPIEKLFLSSQRLDWAVRQVSLAAPLFASAPATAARLPRSHSFAQIEGDVVVTSLRQKNGGREIRVFNARNRSAEMIASGAMGAIRLDEKTAEPKLSNDGKFSVAARRILTLRCGGGLT